MLLSFLGSVAATKLAQAGGGGASPHRYWKIYTLDTKDRGPFNPLIKEIEMASSIGGSDLCSGGTAIGSSNYTGSLPASAFDNDLGTWWQDNSYTDREVGYDFGPGNAQTIEEIRAYCWGTYNERFPCIGYVASSDNGSTWVIEWYFGIESDALFDGYVSLHRPTTASACRCWGIWINDWAIKGTDVTSLIELELRETIGGADATSPGGTLITSLANNSFPASNAFDDNTGTLFAGSINSLPSLLGYDFGPGVTKTIVEVSIRSRESPYHTQTPTGFWIIKSDDGINWTIAADITVGTAWAQLETRAFAV